MRRPFAERVHVYVCANGGRSRGSHSGGIALRLATLLARRHLERATERPGCDDDAWLLLLYNVRWLDKYEPGRPRDTTSRLK